MGISILGIIVVQFIWINNAIQVKNELFDRSVGEALNNTIKRLEIQHDIEIITELPQPDGLQWNRKPVPFPPVPAKPLKIIRNPRAKAGNRIKLQLGNNPSPVHVVQVNHDMDSIQRFTFSNHDTIYTTTTALVKSTFQHLNSVETIVDTTTQIAPKVKERIEFRSENLKNLSSRVAHEIATLDKDFVPLNEINHILKRELQNQHIDLNYDAAIFEHDTIRSMTEKADSLSLLTTSYQTNLFPRAIIDRDTKLAIFFPDQNQYVYRSISWLLLASFFFSIFILLTFALNIFFMLKQKKISEMKSDFINNMTHEFKTPIATISVAADSIKNQKVINQPAKIHYFIDMIKKENSRMNKQVEDILTIARLDKKDFEFNWEPLDIHQLIEEAIERIILQVEKRGGTIETDFRAINPTITTDRTHCANVIYNLLDNANKYSNENPEIKVETRNTDKGVIILISDKGIGMCKAVQTKIFERFYRQTSGNIHNVKGFGLGLSYVKAVIEANKGSISVQSEPGKGSRFDVFLPFTRAV